MCTKSVGCAVGAAAAELVCTSEGGSGAALPCAGLLCIDGLGYEAPCAWLLCTCGLCFGAAASAGLLCVGGLGCRAADPCDGLGSGVATPAFSAASASLGRLPRLVIISFCSSLHSDDLGLLRALRIIGIRAAVAASSSGAPLLDASTSGVQGCSSAANSGVSGSCVLAAVLHPAACRQILKKTVTDYVAWMLRNDWKVMEDLAWRSPFSQSSCWHSNVHIKRLLAKLRYVQTVELLEIGLHD